MVLEPAFATSNFIARELGYSLTGGWRQDDSAHPFLGGWAECAEAVRAAFAPVETYRARFGALLAEVREAGFEAVELWSGHLNPHWATDQHLAIACEVIDEHGLRVVGFHGYLGDSRDTARRACRITAALGAGLLTGGGGRFLDSHRADAVAMLRDHGIRLAIENHPEHAAPAQLLAEIGESADGTIGVNLDTGWWATHGQDPVEAITALSGHLLHVQLKDIAAPGTHHPAALGTGCVPVRDCLRALAAAGYRGAYSLEHLAADASPVAACREARRMLVRLRSEPVTIAP
ncbi:sugar phosphate isomerase/epimerase family protein [Kitasatospora griseola]|uniref:sugar phosphate isomerase/epimerase family protein n=1 Tax=Kitasatospora griseola TaxID=2064 RepID=UPI0036DD0060